MATEFDQYITDERARFKWRLPLAWSALLAMGWLIYELTTQPAVGVFAVCIKFGWNDFRTAAWLLRIDPERKRARACFLLYLASGLWKTAITGTLVTFGIVGWVEARDPAGRMVKGPPPHFEGAFAAAAIGSCLSVLGTVLAIIFALRDGIKLWLHPAVHRVRAMDAWPPVFATTSPLANRFNRLISFTLWSIGLVFIFALLMGFVAAFHFLGLGVDKQVFAIVLSLVLFGVGAAGFKAGDVTKEFLNRRIVAQTPAECWKPAISLD